MMIVSKIVAGVVCSCSHLTSVSFGFFLILESSMTPVSVELSSVVYSQSRFVFAMASIAASEHVVVVAGWLLRLVTYAPNSGVTSVRVSKDEQPEQ